MKALLLISLLFSISAEARPVIMLTGYWPPTNEMLREFSPNSAQNRGVWRGENWENSGFDIQAYFPEFPNGGQRGEGDFEVDFNDTKLDLERITAELKPVALLSFGQGQGPWEIEYNFPDFWHGGPTLQSTLPVDAIAQAVNATDSVPAWIDWRGNPGDFLCGYISYLGAQYRVSHEAVKAQGFIHVGTGYSAAKYREALHATLRALVRSL